MGNADWNPTQTRVFDVYMASGGDQGGGQGLMDIFSCNGGNNGNGEDNEDDDPSNKENRHGSSSTSASNEDTRSHTHAHTYTHTHNNNLNSPNNGCALGANLAGNGITSSHGINAVGTASTAVPPGSNVNSASTPPIDWWYY